MAIQKAYNGCAPMTQDHSAQMNSVAMEVTGAEAMLGFDPRSLHDEYHDSFALDFDDFEDNDDVF